MTDDTTTTGTGTETPPTGATPDETFAWTAEPETGSGPSVQAREWLTQLQSMIENLATQAAPVVREIGAKAAELAAVAGDKAGPVAQRAAEMTADAGQKLAARSRDLAAELRRDLAADAETSPTMSETTAAEEPKTTADIT
jgi:hypothetical protein